MARSKLVIFGYELDATEGMVNGTLVAWQIDADKRAVSLALHNKHVDGQLWERVADRHVEVYRSVKVNEDGTRNTVIGFDRA